MNQLTPLTAARTAAPQPGLFTAVPAGAGDFLAALAEALQPAPHQALTPVPEDAPGDSAARTPSTAPQPQAMAAAEAEAPQQVRPRHFGFPVSEAALPEQAPALTAEATPSPAAPEEVQEAAAPVVRPQALDEAAARTVTAADELALPRTHEAQPPGPGPEAATAVTGTQAGMAGTASRTVRGDAETAAIPGPGPEAATAVTGTQAGMAGVPARTVSASGEPATARALEAAPPAPRPEAAAAVVRPVGTAAVPAMPRTQRTAPQAETPPVMLPPTVPGQGSAQQAPAAPEVVLTDAPDAGATVPVQGSPQPAAPDDVAVPVKDMTTGREPGHPAVAPDTAGASAASPAGVSTGHGDPVHTAPETPRSTQPAAPDDVAVPVKDMTTGREPGHPAVAPDTAGASAASPAGVSTGHDDTAHTAPETPRSTQPAGMEPTAPAPEAAQGQSAPALPAALSPAVDTTAHPASLQPAPGYIAPAVSDAPAPARPSPGPDPRAAPVLAAAVTAGFVPASYPVVAKSPLVSDRAPAESSIVGQAGPSPVTVQVPAPQVQAPAAAPVQAPAPVPAAFAPQPALHTQLAKPLFTMATSADGEQIMTVRVSPDELGPVTVRATIGTDGVRMELAASTDAGRDALKAILPDLKRDLAGQGLDARLDLSSGNGQGPPSDGRGERATARHDFEQRQRQQRQEPETAADENLRMYNQGPSLDVMA